MTTLHAPPIGSNGHAVCESRLHTPSAETAVAVFRRYFFNRTDLVAFKPPAAWKSAACPAIGDDHFDDLLARHVDGGPYDVHWKTKDGKSGVEPVDAVHIGTYSPAVDNTTIFAAVDFDGGEYHKNALADPLGAALELVERCRRLGLAAYLVKSRSGAGYHVWLFFTEPIAAALTRRLVFALLPTALLQAKTKDGEPKYANAKTNAGIEVFPKQDQHADANGIGNQVWLPWCNTGKNDGGLFHQISGTGEIEPYLPEDLTTNSVELVNNIVAELPEERKRPTRPKASTWTPPTNGDRVPAADILAWALRRVSGRNRNDVGLDLACQLRDNRYSRAEADPVMSQYAAAVGNLSDHAYTESEALSSLASAYSRSPREPWSLKGSGRFIFGKPRSTKGTHDEHEEAGKPEDHEEAKADEQPREPMIFANFYEEETTVGDRTVKIKRGLAAAHLGRQLRTAITANWPKRVGRLLFARDGDSPHYLESSTDLFAWIGRQLQGDVDNPLQWVSQGATLLPKAEFHAHLQQTCDVFAAVQPYPHWPTLQDHFYIHPPLQGGDGKALARFLARFCPDSKHDGELLKGAMLTLAAGLSPGDRPGFLLTGPEDDAQAGRGVGKTTFVELCAMLFGGYVVARDGDDMPDFIKRLLSPEGRGKRVILIDNIKTLRLSWADLEALITCATISGRQMFVGEGQLPNTFTVCLTINGATLSRDMAQRCVIVKLARPEYSATWEEDAKADIEANRWAIIGDLVAELKRPVKPLARYSRWGAWERTVLARLNDPAALQSLIEQRQGEADDDTEEADLVREAIRLAPVQARHNPDTENVLIPSKRLASIVNEAMGDKRPTNKVSAYLRTLQLPELRISRRGDARGWVWNGPEAGMTETVAMNPPPVFYQTA